MKPALHVQQINVAYREAIVLDQVTFTLPAGEVMGVVGPNGAGKSTLLKAILGIIPALTGEVHLLEKPLGQVRAKIGYMPQQNDVDWDFPATVRDVVTMGLYGKIGWFRRLRKADREQVEQAMAQAGVQNLANQQIGQLSGGQKQRTFLARTIVSDPELIFMDEPFAGVDAASEAAIMKVIKQLQSSGKTIVVVHHDLATVANFCSWVLILNKHVVAIGPRSEVFQAQTIKMAYGLDKIDEEVTKTWAS